MTDQKRVFKTKTFDRWAKKLLSDDILCRAAREIAQGLFEADLGGGICKKRVAIAGMGKSGGTRTLVAKQHAAAIFFLLFLLFNSVKFATLIITVLPFASVGGVIGLFIAGEYLSVPASVGFIALWGIAVLNGVVLVSYIRSLREGGMSVKDAVLEGARQRFRPVMMTATVAMLGLIPFLISDGPGSEVQRPLAIVVIGGLITCTLLTLVVVPTIYHWFDETLPEA